MPLAWLGIPYTVPVTLTVSLAIAIATVAGVTVRMAMIMALVLWYRAIVNTARPQARRGAAVGS